MLIDYFKVIAKQTTDLNVHETFKELKLECQLTEYSWDLLSGLINHLRKIPKRDTFELTVEINGSDRVITSTESVDVQIVKEFFESDDADEIKLELLIVKSERDQVTSIYFLKNLEKYIKATSINKLLISFGRFFQEKHNFEVFEEISSFGSLSINFDTYDNLNTSFGINGRDSKLSEIRENACKLFDDCNFLIDDFTLVERNQVYPDLMVFFDIVAMSLAFSTFSNTLSLNELDEISFKINGYKTVDAKNIQLKTLKYDISLLNKISTWIFESGQYSDKLGLIRNILSLHVDDTGLVEINDHTWLAIKSNYEIYLKDNIQQYIEIKNKLTDYIFSYNTKVYDLSDQFQSSFRANIVAIIGFIISVVIVNGFKDGGVKTIFSGEYLYVVIAISCISVLWMWFSKNDLIHRADNAENNIKSVLSRNYQNVLMKDEIDSYIDPAFLESKAYLNSQLDKYTCWWSTILTLFILIFIVGYFVFSPGEEVKNSGVVLIPLEETVKDPGTEKIKDAKIKASPKIDSEVDTINVFNNKMQVKAGVNDLEYDTDPIGVKTTPKKYPVIDKKIK